MDILDMQAYALDRIYKAFDRRDPPVPAATPEPSSFAPVEGPSPHDGTRTAGAVDPNYCRICTPKGYGCCRCEIACNE